LPCAEPRTTTGPDYPQVSEEPWIFWAFQNIPEHGFSNKSALRKDWGLADSFEVFLAEDIQKNALSGGILYLQGHFVKAHHGLNLTECKTAAFSGMINVRNAATSLLIVAFLTNFNQHV
jgi:hypothetical protein